MDGLATRVKGAQELTKRKYRDIMVVRRVASVYGHCRLVLVWVRGGADAVPVPD